MKPISMYCYNLTTFVNINTTLKILKHSDMQPFTYTIVSLTLNCKINP